MTRRFELKYLISVTDAFKLERVLKTLLLPDKNNLDDGYLVTTTYLDDRHNSAFADKVFGQPKHTKYRIRHYNDDLSHQLEKKIKNGDLTHKTKVPISLSEKEQILTDVQGISTNSNDLFKELFLEHQRHNLRETVTITYRRKAFVDETEQCRITFDYDVFVHQRDRFQPRFNKRVVPANQVLLEIKYTHFLPDQIKRLFATYKNNQIAISKYFMGVSEYRI